MAVAFRLFAFTTMSLTFAPPLISKVDLPFTVDNSILRITKIDSLRQITNSQPAQAIYLFDVDDTLIDSPYMLGSKAWRKYIRVTTKDDPTENWHDVFSLFLARNYPLKTVEGLTSQFISELQQNGYGVFGLTSRERKVWYDTPVNDIDSLTVIQLKSLGIDFDGELLNERYPYFFNNSTCFEGVFFADIEPKGEYLLKLLQDAPRLPEKVIFIDDKLTQVESVAAALHQLNIDYECYWYTATDDKANCFDPLIANIQLYYFWISGGESVMSDEEASVIAKEYPEKTAEHYLRSLTQEKKTQDKCCARLKV